VVHLPKIKNFTTSPFDAQILLVQPYGWTLIPKKKEKKDANIPPKENAI
jgi:hypothetical protein